MAMGLEMDDLYQFSKILDQETIRLILLEPSHDPDAEIRCSLINAPPKALDEEGRYFANNNVHTVAVLFPSQKSLSEHSTCASHLEGRDNTEHYTALTYVWGDPILSHNARRWQKYIR